jgi:hypothetical protein
MLTTSQFSKNISNPRETGRLIFHSYNNCTRHNARKNILNGTKAKQFKQKKYQRFAVMAWSKGVRFSVDFSLA